jgi:UDP:flavonoid glycosyltransferase YjiC (YdhE family)
MKGLAAGVPMVCIPIGRDQTDNAARIVGLGAGVKVKPKASVATIRAAVEDVLAGTSYRDAAGAMAKTISAGDGQADIVATIEATTTAVPKTNQ